MCILQTVYWLHIVSVNFIVGPVSTLTAQYIFVTDQLSSPLTFLEY